MYAQPLSESQSNFDISQVFYAEKVCHKFPGVIRWLTTISLCFAALLTYYFTADGVVALQQLVVLISVTAVSLAQTVQCQKRVFTRQPTMMLELQLYAFSWSAFFYISCVIDKPLIFLLLPYVVFAAAILPLMQAWVFGIMTISSYLLLQAIHQHTHFFEFDLASGFDLFTTRLAFAVTVIATIWFISSVSRSMRIFKSDLNMAREMAMRDKWILSIGGFAVSAAHELSTPLSTLTTLVDEMKELPAPILVTSDNLELMDTQLNVCRQALNRLTRKANYSYANTTDYCPADVWLCRLKNNWQALHPLTEIDMELDSQIDRQYLLPDITLEQALSNLVDNAIAAHPTKIKITVNSSLNKLNIRIIDYGPGIQEDVLSFIEQGQPQVSKRGLGLGVVLAKGSIERYGGKVEFGKSPQGGTEVSVMLPLLGSEKK